MIQGHPAEGETGGGSALIWGFALEEDGADARSSPREKPRGFSLGAPFSLVPDWGVGARLEGKRPPVSPPAPPHPAGAAPLFPASTGFFMGVGGGFSALVLLEKAFAPSNLVNS